MSAIIGRDAVAWPHTLDTAGETPPVVPVDLVTIADKTNIAPRSPRNRSRRRRKHAAAGRRRRERRRRRRRSCAAPEAASRRRPRPKRDPKPGRSADSRSCRSASRSPTKQKFDVDTVLGAARQARAEAGAARQRRRLADSTIKGIGAQNAMTMDLEDALQSQMRECWNVPVGAPNPEQLIVQVRVFLNAGRHARTAAAIDAGDPRGGGEQSLYARGGGSGTARDQYLRALSRLPADQYDAVARDRHDTSIRSKMIGRAGRSGRTMA